MSILLVVLVSMSRKFTHFTNSKKSLLNILEHGFAWMRNDRQVIEMLLPNVDFSRREPQSFGQVCFTENTYESNRDHTKFFGSFGIQVSSAWADKHNIQPVIYIPETGPILESLSFLFDQTFRKAMVEERFPDDSARQQWMVSASMASITGKPLYAALLKLYEYMEPIQHAAEREWRIVNPNTDWGIPDSIEKTIKNVSPPKGWLKILGVIPIEPKDIVALVCRKQDVDGLSASLQDRFKHIPINAH